MIILFWMCMHQLRMKAMAQGMVSVRNQSKYLFTFPPCEKPMWVIIEWYTRASGLC